MTKTLLNILLSTFLVLCGTALIGQTTVVSGKVTDAVSGEPVPFANVYFQGTKIGTTTDFDGLYTLESYYATDSLVASFIGYKNMALAVRKDVRQEINFTLKTGSINLGEAVVKVDKDAINPAHPIIRSCLANKKINNREKLEAYEYESYNKVEFDLNNISEEFQNRKIFKHFDFIFENIDSTEEKTYLPVFMTESISDFYYRKNPKTSKEVIKGTKVSGVKNNSVSQFLGDMYQNVNVYDNEIGVFGKSFVSPISSYGFGFYRYYLQDSAYIDNKWCYKIDFIPKRKQEATFTGHMWINDTTYAVKSVEGTIAEDANINFIHGFKVKQTYQEVQKEVWMLAKDELVVDFNLGEKQMGIYGRKTTSYQDFVINEERTDDFYKGLSDVIVADDANDHSEEYWAQQRHLKLSENEKSVYAMVDSMGTIPQVRSAIDIITLLFTGYKVVGKFEIGPYSKLYSYNPIEGHRVRLGGRTSNAFSTRLLLEGYGAYGFTDKQFKYGGGFKYFVSKKPRQFVGAFAKKDVELLGQNINFSSDNAFSSLFRRTPLTKLTNVTEFRAFYGREWFYGLSNKIQFTHRILRPLGDLQFSKINDEKRRENVGRITTSEISLYTRFAFKEKFVSGEFERVSLGTKFPTIEIFANLGVPDVWGSDYAYKKLELRISDKVKFGPFGYMKLRAEAGNIWGKLPFPLLELHQGNETFWYDESAFNTMNFFEFVSDKYARVFATYHMDGLLFNKIPLLRKLKWREVLSARAVVGGFDKNNLEELQLPAGTFTLRQPFAEAAVGVENIFKVLRIDFLYRLTYLDNPDIVRFGIRAKFQIDF